MYSKNIFIIEIYYIFCQLKTLYSNQFQIQFSKILRNQYRKSNFFFYFNIILQYQQYYNYNNRDFLNILNTKYIETLNIISLKL